MEKAVEIPQGVAVEYKAGIMSVRGPKGELSRRMESSEIKVAVSDGEAKFTSATGRRKNMALTGTFAAHMRNMVAGVTHGYEARLKTLYSHFPIKVKVEGSKVVIQNFLGERDSRVVEIAGGVQVKASKDEVIVSGISKEDVGQTAGRIERAAMVRGFDRRVFQDGIHLVQKARIAGKEAS